MEPPTESSVSAPLYVSLVWLRLLLAACLLGLGMLVPLWASLPLLGVGIGLSISAYRHQQRLNR